MEEIVLIKFDTDKISLRRETNFIEQELKKLEDSIKVDLKFDTENIKRRFNNLLIGLRNSAIKTTIDLSKIFKIDAAQTKLNTFIKTLNNAENKPIELKVNNQSSTSAVTPAVIAASAAVQTSATNSVAKSQTILNKEVHTYFKELQSVVNISKDIGKQTAQIGNEWSVLPKSVEDLRTKIEEILGDLENMVFPNEEAQEAIDEYRNRIIELYSTLDDVNGKTLEYIKTIAGYSDELNDILKPIIKDLESIGEQDISIDIDSSKSMSKLKAIREELIRLNLPIEQLERPFKILNKYLLGSIKLLKRMVPSIKGIKGAFTYVGKSAFNSLKTIQQGLTGIYAKVTALAGGVGLGFLAKDFLSTAVATEKLKLTLETLEGSSDKAKESFAWISKFATKTPYELNQVTESFIRLKAYGIDPTTGTLSTLGDTASAMGKPLMQGVEALADALTGENERLKEFGIKASKHGDEILYNWTDASGKARHIIIENNKAVIQSTLMAIWNNKYKGAMDQQSKSFAGIWTNIKDSYTNFKNAIMQGGLFDYLKSISIYIKKFTQTAFGEGKKKAKEASDTVINGIKSIIKSIGFMYDAFNGIKLSLVTGKIAWQEWALFVNKIILKVFKAVDALGRKLDSFFRDAIIKYNDYARVLLMPKMDVPKPRVNKDTSYVKEQNRLVQDLNNGLKESNEEFSKLIEQLMNQEGVKSAEKIIDKIDKINEGLKKSKEELQKPNAPGLIGEGSFPKPKTKEITKEINKTIKHVKTQADKLYDEWANRMRSLGSIFTDSIKLALSGDIRGAITNLFSGLGDDLMEGVLDKYKKSLGQWWSSVTESISSSISSMFGGGDLGSMMADAGSLLTGGFMSFLSNIAGVIIDSLLNDTVTQAEIDASKGKTEFSDNALKNLKDSFEKAQTPLYDINYQMYKRLKSMDENFYTIARAFSQQASKGGIDLTGSNFVDVEESGFLGFSSKAISLIGSGLQFYTQALGEIVNEEMINATAYTTKLVEKSSWFGLKHKSYIDETFQELPDSIKSDMAKNFQLGYEQIFESAVKLGFDPNTISKYLNNAIIDMGKIDFTGLSDAEVTNRISQAFSEALSGVVDQIPVLTDLVDRYRQGLESSMDTLGRITKEFLTANHYFTLLGKEFKEGTKKSEENYLVTEVIQVGISLREYMQQTADLYELDSIDVLAAVREWNKAGRVITETFTKTMTRIVDTTYTAQEQMLDIVKSAGGEDQFNEAMNVLMQKYYTNEEQLVFATKSMEASFEALGVTMFKSRDEFREYLSNIDTSKQSGAELYGSLLRLADGFDQVMTMSEELADTLEISFSGIIDIVEAWNSSLSYLNTPQKAGFTSQAYNILYTSGYKDQEQSLVEVARMQAEAAQKSASSVEEYIPYFDKYIYALEQQPEAATLDDVVYKIDEAIDVIREQESTLRRLT